LRLAAAPGLLVATAAVGGARSPGFWRGRRQGCGAALYKAPPHAIIRGMRPTIIISALYSALRWRKPAA
jgi:hypothetical protein